MRSFPKGADRTHCRRLYIGTGIGTRSETESRPLRMVVCERKNYEICKGTLKLITLCFVRFARIIRPRSEEGISKPKQNLQNTALESVLDGNLTIASFSHSVLTSSLASVTSRSRNRHQY